MSEVPVSTVSFSDLGLPPQLMQVLSDVGYENPSPIQAQTIPYLLAGRDVLGQAQTGTGKTAAFALPMLAGIDVALREVQAVVLAPTRELAIQVAEAFQKYATHIKGFHVLPIYGGASYNTQLSGLRRGAHVVVGTPGRVMDHIKRGTLKLESLRFVALDEADEMLRMGFIDDVEWILQQMPEKRQVALFSATMPAQVRRIAQKYLKNPAEVTIRAKTTTAANTRQRFWEVSGLHKLDALTRILEAESFDAMIIFTRTKIATEELAERLEARGFAVAPLNGDIPQQLRERAVQRLRDGQLDILVATDVAARGLDVERITHVVNFDIPLDIESYVHRIGRTGRAGRSGEAILFVAPRERRMLAAIERATRQPIERMELPTVEAVNNQRVNKFKARITESLESGELEMFRGIIDGYEQEHNIPAIEIAAALARMAQGKTPLLLKGSPRGETRNRYQRDDDRGERREAFKPSPSREREPAFKQAAAPPRPQVQPQPETVVEPVDGPELDEELMAEVFEAPRHEVKKPSPATQETAQRPERRERAERPERSEQSGRPEQVGRDDRPRRSQSGESAEQGMETYRVAVGHEHEVKPGNIVGAIANEGGIDSKYIGRIQIFDNYSLVDLPKDMPKEILQHLKKVWVAGQELRITLQRPGAPTDKPFKREERAVLSAPRREPGRGYNRDSAPASREPRAPRPAGSFAERDSSRPRSGGFSKPGAFSKGAKPKGGKPSFGGGASRKKPR